MINVLLDKVENILVKGENAGYQQYLLVPKYFRMVSFPGLLKPGIVW